MNILRQPIRYVNFNATYWLIGINILVFAAMYFFKDTPVPNLDISDLGIKNDYGFIYREMQMSLMDMFAMKPYAVIKNGAVWTFFTYMFLHGGISHIFFNMFALYVFGTSVERQLGSWEFLLFYLLTGVLAGVFSFVVYYLTGSLLISLVGASGAIFAVQLAYAVCFPHAVLHIWGILPIRAPVMVLVFTIASLFFIFSGRGGNVAHLTHLAGFLFAWLYFIVRFGVSPWKRLTSR